MFDFSGDDTNFLEAYNRLFCVEGHEPDMLRDEFHLGYIIFVYKSSTNMQNTLSLERRKHTRLVIKFSQATSEALSVLVYGKPFLLFFYSFFCLYTSLFYKVFNTQGIQGRCYNFYLAIPACPYLMHIIQLCTLKIIISEFDYYYYYCVW